MRPVIDNDGDGGGWDIRQPRRNALGLAQGSNIPVTLDGTGSGALWHPPVAATAPTLPVHPMGGGEQQPPIHNPIDPMNMGMGNAYAGGGLGGVGGGPMGGPITPRMVRPRGDRGNTGW